MRHRSWRRNRKVTLVALALVVLGMVVVALAAGSGSWDDWWDDDDHHGHHQGHHFNHHPHHGFDVDFNSVQQNIANVNINNNVNTALSVFGAGSCGGPCWPGSCFLLCDGPPCGGGCHASPCWSCGLPGMSVTLDNNTVITNSVNINQNNWAH